MTTVKLGAPPSLKGYQDYKPWLLHHFFDHICSYCLLKSDSLEVDHYEPQKYAPRRVDDPTNLLLACSRCNGPSGKWDYHPAHKKRRCRWRDRSGHHLLDVRRDDFALLFEISADGGIRARSGPEEERANWNIALLKLDIKSCVQARAQLQDLKESCEDALNLLAGGPDPKTRASVERMFRKTLLPELARRALFLRVFEIPVSASLQSEIEQEIATQRPLY
jgi:uncharacterized protein (TIGR02646 family)